MYILKSEVEEVVDPETPKANQKLQNMKDKDQEDHTKQQYFLPISTKERWHFCIASPDDQKSTRFRYNHIYVRLRKITFKLPHF